MPPVPDADSGSPCTAPIISIDDLIGWQENRALIHEGVTALESRLPPEGPRTLVCHDMKGGYTEDRFVQGYNSSNVFTFYHWDLIDSFVYFSHNLVTIPPAGWINAAHVHGVPVLGTFITEWESGKKVSEQLLSDPEIMSCVTSQLASIARLYGFDGWLLNIENSLKKTLVHQLVEFVKSLSAKMHDAKPGSQVIWYDSITEDGNLEYQNQLNSKNRVFYEECDGIFVNYEWNPLIVSQPSPSTSKTCAVPSANRRYDVYLGVDVFVRKNREERSGFNSYKELKLARELNYSAALFAPGWVYESFKPENFLDNDKRLWGSSRPYLTKRIVANRLPLSTSFCTGQGEKLFIYGQVVSERPWTNLSLQQIISSIMLEESGGCRVKMYRKDAFIGGGCLELIGEGGLSSSLLDCEITIYKPLFIAFSWKPLTEGARLQICLQLERSGSESREVHLTSSEENVQELAAEDIPNTLRLDGANFNGWQYRVFKCSGLESQKLTQIGFSVSASYDRPSCLLGSIQILGPDDLILDFTATKHLPVKDLVVKLEADNHYSISGILQWFRDEGVKGYHVWLSESSGNKRWLGYSFSSRFCFSKVKVTSSQGSRKFILQRVYASGIVEPVSEEAAYAVDY